MCDSKYMGTVAQHPEPHRLYLIAARALTATAGIVSVASIALSGASFTLHTRKSQESHREDSMVAMYALLIGLIVLESALCLIAMAACFGLLFTRPHAVLIRKPQHGSFQCLCASVFLLFAFAIYSVAICIVCAMAYVSPAVFAVNASLNILRCAALISFFAVLLCNSKVQPFDTLY